MGRLLRQRTVSLLGLLAACAMLPAAVIHFFGETEVQIPGAVHFLPIGISAGLAATAALVLTLAGARRGDARSVLIGTAFSAMAGLLSIHGLATPGFLVGDNGLVASPARSRCRSAARSSRSPRSLSCGALRRCARCSRSRERCSWRSWGSAWRAS